MAATTFSWLANQQALNKAPADYEDTVSLPGSLKDEYLQNVQSLKQSTANFAARNEDDDDNKSVSSVLSSWSASSSSSSSRSTHDDDHNDSSGQESSLIDSGVDPGSGDEADSDSSERHSLHCDDDCFCHRLKRWLDDHADRARDILQDGYFQEHPEIYHVEPQATHREPQQCAFDPIPCLSQESYRYAGEREKLGRIHGRGTVYFPNGRKFCGVFRQGIREGPGELFDREGARILSGTYVADRLEGVCEIAMCDGGMLAVRFQNGVASGPARRFSQDGYLHWVGRYRMGMPEGLCWRSNDNEGWYVGENNRHHRMTGDEVIYLYPDFHTALVGRWENDCMKAASLAMVVGLTERQGLPWPIVQRVPSSDTFFSDQSGISDISSNPLLRDPYEASLVSCSSSSVAEGGEGLFAAIDIPQNTVVAFYNGVRFHDCHAFNDWEHNSYKIRLNEKKKQILDIPSEFRSLSKYRATLAHKINHSFFPNARFADYAHPRFGRILCVKTTRPLAAGEELFCNYGYHLSDCPDWYKSLHEDVFGREDSTAHKENDEDSN